MFEVNKDDYSPTSLLQGYNERKLLMNLMIDVDSFKHIFMSRQVQHNPSHKLSVVQFSLAVILTNILEENSAQRKLDSLFEADFFYLFKSNQKCF